VDRRSLLKIIDAFMGSIAVRLLKKATSVSVPASPRKALFIRPGGIGDAVLLVPAVTAFSRAYPEAAVDVLAERRNRDVFKMCPMVSNTYCYDSFRDFGTVLSNTYDIVIDTEQWHRLSAVVARIIGGKMSIGFATNERARMFNSVVQYSHSKYEVDSFLSLLDPLTIDRSEPSLPYLHLPKEAAERAGSALGPLAFQNFITLFPGASVKEKCWGDINFKRLAAELHRKCIPLVVLGNGIEDVKAAEAIVDGTNALNLVGKTTLIETAGVLDRAVLSISGDSGVLHMAIGLGTPTISLFGPSNVLKWAPIMNPHTVLHRGLQCSPCSKFGLTPQCRRGTECMAIPVEHVLHHVVKLWDSSR
jgi:ADP-heptose:LPS heptosyltransferase